MVLLEHMLAVWSAGGEGVVYEEVLLGCVGRGESLGRCLSVCLWSSIKEFCRVAEVSCSFMATEQ